jgi:hypothetical protein
MEKTMIAGAQAAWAETHELEKVLEYLRANKSSKSDCITVVKHLGIVEKRDAKRAVHFSATWRDHLTADTATHDALGVTLKLSNDELRFAVRRPMNESTRPQLCVDSFDYVVRSCLLQHAGGSVGMEILGFGFELPSGFRVEKTSSDDVRSCIDFAGESAESSRGDR